MLNASIKQLLDSKKSLKIKYANIKNIETEKKTKTKVIYKKSTITGFTLSPGNNPLTGFKPCTHNENTEIMLKMGKKVEIKYIAVIKP